MKVLLSLLFSWIFLTPPALAKLTPWKWGEDSPEIPEITMDEYMLSSAEHIPVIQTYGASTCILLVLYDADAKLGGLMHISATQDEPRAVWTMVKQLKDLGAKNLTARFYGGWSRRMSEQYMFNSTSESSFREMRKTLKARGIEITDSSHVLYDPEQMPAEDAIINLGLDLRTGQVFRFNQNVFYQSGPRREPPPFIGTTMGNTMGTTIPRKHPLSL